MYTTFCSLTPTFCKVSLKYGKTFSERDQFDFNFETPSENSASQWL